MHTKASQINWIHELGSTIERRWKSKDYTPQIFPKLASDCLKEHLANETINFDRLFSELKTIKSLPKQFDLPGKFGNPPLTLFRDKQNQFIIDLLFWLKPEIAIHDHRFSGAFAVVKGNSLHCQYFFKSKEQPSKKLHIGDLKLGPVKYLKTGEVMAVPAGRSFIHCVWHLNFPTVSLIARTITDERIDFQYEYYSPHIAHSSKDPSELVVRKLQLEKYLREIKYNLTEDFVSDSILKGDPSVAFTFLRNFYFNTHNQDLLNKYIKKLLQQHGSWVKMMEEALLKQDVAHRIKWEIVRNPSHRLLLSLLVTFKERKPIANFIKETYPQKSFEEVVPEWLEDISKQGAFLFKIPKESYPIIKTMLKGLSPEETKRKLEESLSKEFLKENKIEIQKLCKQLKEFDLLKPLFT